jgi:hypothetical protein
MEELRTDTIEATTTENTEAQAPTEGAEPTAPPTETEEIAKVAYAKCAEELKWKGDFPAWELISDRARQLYIEGVQYIQGLATPAQAAEQVINHELQAEGAEDVVARVTPKPRTRFEEVVLEVLHG